MTIAAKDSLGVFAECPHCHHSLQHGFQVCTHCGDTVSAEEQQALRNQLKKNVALSFLVFVVVLSVVLGGVYKLFS
jgi:predicted nucleic acid-binding Zn ribbon protein